jgi:hypothetical protein
MDITIFLAQIWGPVILAVGIGVFTSRSYYLKVYRDLEKETLAVLLFAMFAPKRSSACLAGGSSSRARSSLLLRAM